MFIDNTDHFTHNPQMRNLIVLLLRYGGFIVFLVLEIFCMFLVVRYNRTQREIYVNSSNVFSGSLNTKVSNVTRYFNLTNTSDSLAVENARLYEKLSNLDLDRLMKDSVYVASDSVNQFRFISARIINNSINKNNNFLTIKKGRLDGIKPRQGVVSDKGVVGIVRNVSDHFATVLSVLHRQIRINAAVKRTNNFGAIAWRGNDPTIVKLEDIPTHARPIVGDTIITSGNTSRFPKGITLGVIDTFWRASGSNFYDIEVKLTNDFNSLEYVYVIDNEYIEEQLELEQQLIDEQ